jgi:Uma2 family endonuclease
MAQVADKLWTLEEFLAFGGNTRRRYELFEGRIVAMNPPLRGHSGLVGRLARIIGNQLEPPCEVFAESGVIPANRARSWYEADLIVTCTPGNPKDQFIAEPVLVVEVLSPSTGRTDFKRKLPDQQRIASMRDILLIASEERKVRHWRREPDGWREQQHRDADTLRLSALPVVIRTDDLYDGLLPPRVGT